MAPKEIQFGNQGCGSCDWRVVVDGVMGGRSSGELVTTDTSIIFKGEVSLENNGGFSSIRTSNTEFDLSPFTAVTIRYRLTGQQFAFRLSQYRRFYRPSFRVILPATNNEWSTIMIKLASLEKARLGEVLEGSPSQEDLASVIRLGFISNDKKAGEFEFEIDFIKFT